MVHLPPPAILHLHAFATPFSPIEWCLFFHLPCDIALPFSIPATPSKFSFSLLSFLHHSIHTITATPFQHLNLVPFTFTFGFLHASYPWGQVSQDLEDNLSIFSCLPDPSMKVVIGNCVPYPIYALAAHALLVFPSLPLISDLSPYQEEEEEGMCLSWSLPAYGLKEDGWRKEGDKEMSGEGRWSLSLYIQWEKEQWTVGETFNASSCLTSLTLPHLFLPPHPFWSSLISQNLNEK